MIDKIRNLAKFSIFFSSSFKPLIDLKYWQDLKSLSEKFAFGTDWLIGDGPLVLFFSVLPLNNHENSDLNVSRWQNYEDQKNRYGFQVTSRFIGWHNESSGVFQRIIFTLSSRILSTICFVGMPALFVNMIILTRSVT